MAIDGQIKTTQDIIANRRQTDRRTKTFNNTRILNNIIGYSTAKTPQPTWLFNVYLFFNDKSPAVESSAIHKSIASNDAQNTCKVNPISCTLPTEETHTAEQFFLGTKRTVTTFKDRSGECTMEFYYRDASEIGKKEHWGESLFRLIADSSSKMPGEDIDVKHTELCTNLLSSVEIWLVNPDGSFNTVYKLYNPIITNLEHSGDLNYESEEFLKWTMTIHYDWWEVR